MKRIEIINKKFPHAFWGYDVTEVDLFLDEIIREFDRLHNELDIAAFTADAAREREEKLRAKIEELTAALHGETGEPEPDEAQEAEESEPESEPQPDDPLGAYTDEDTGGAE